ncbi:MAG TPA: ATP-binding protein [Solirubrobacterales bacterium]|nr:ATP-binding protein [Solirubrobacterales bacterium]
MSERLGQALVATISRSAADGAAWLLVDGVTPEVGEAIAADWDKALPRLVVVGPAEANFRGFELGEEPVTALRNAGPVCLVLCEGEAIADSQSIRGFDHFSPGDLTADREGLAQLASQNPDVSSKPGVEAVLEALSDPHLERSPSPLAVCRFLDAVAAGSKAVAALPELGAFHDSDGVDLGAARVVANLNLAGERSSAERLRPSALREMRSRAEELEGVDAIEVFELTIRQDAALLRLLDFDQATAMFEDPPSSGLRGDVEAAVKKFQERDEEAREAGEGILPEVGRLEEPLEAKEAAAELLKFNEEHQQDVLRAPLVRKLRLLRRERSVKSDSIEVALLRAIDGLPSKLRAIELKEPVVGDNQSSEVQARSILSISAAHVRLEPLLRALEKHGATIAGELLEDQNARLEGVAATLDHPARAEPRRVVLSVLGEGKGDAVEVAWMPDAEDFALLMTMVEFSGGSALSLEADSGAPLGGGVTTAMIRPQTAPAELKAAAEHLQGTAKALLREGFDPALLMSWARTWSEAVEKAYAKDVSRLDVLEALAFAGGIRTADGDATLTLFSPLKAEWLAARTDGWLELLEQVIAANAAEAVVETGDSHPAPLLQTARALAEATAVQYPSFVVSPESEAPLLPVSDGVLFSGFGSGQMTEEVAPVSLAALTDAIEKLIGLHPEAGRHLRCIAWRSGAADLLTSAVLTLLKKQRGIDRAEVLCVEGEPQEDTLGMIDDWARGEDQERLALKYKASLKDVPGNADGGSEFHLAVVQGVTQDLPRPPINTEEVPEPEIDDDVLFAPKTWVRPEHTHMLLAPPTVSEVGRSWLRLMTALDDSWPSPEDPRLRIPELRIDMKGSRKGISRLHELALWVVTLDRFANRKSLEAAVGEDVAILHQERRASGSDVQGLVISQMLGSSADHAIEVSLKRAGMLDEGGAELASALRRAAASGYGILALRAATTGSGINELLGHVAAFNRLTTVATPWPLPPGCRVLILSLDEYASWFGRAKRADMLALALSPEEGGVHAANVEVKAVRDPAAVPGALSEAKEQIRRTLIDSRFAAYPNGSIYSRLWLNRICDAAIAVARETGRRLTADELAALNRFRSGIGGVLEWAGIGMVFAPGAVSETNHSHLPLMRDRVPIAMSSIDLTLGLLQDASSGNGTDLHTAATGRPVLSPSSKQRQAGVSQLQPKSPGKETGGLSVVDEPPPEAEAGEAAPEPEAEPVTAEDRSAVGGAEGLIRHPLLGVDAVAGTPVEWRVSGPEALSNGHIEVYGTSGAGKTQFIMSLLAQMEGMGARFGVCDFKNDYGDGVPDEISAKFFDLWDSPLPFNPLAIDNPSRRALQGLRIELRDTVDIAARPFTRLGHRQLGKLLEAFEQAYEQAPAGGMPTLHDVHQLLDDDLKGVIGDLTGTELFGSGPPLGSVIDQNVIFGLNHIPGTGLTTTLAAGFILSSLYLKLLEMPQVANQVNYLIVIDEAHRVANFHSVASMVRELRSKGLAVVLATQRPGDLPAEASTNAQTKVFLRLPDAQAAREAAKTLDPSDRGLATEIRTLEDGEAFVAIAGGSPIRVKLRQHWRDDRQPD